MQGSIGETDIENRHVHGGRGGEGEIYGKNNMETYTTVCKIDSQWVFAVWLRKLKQGLSINLEWWDGEGGSKGSSIESGYRKANLREASN